MARSAEDCALLLGAMAGHDPLDSTSSRSPVPDYTAGLGDSLEGLRIGLPGSTSATAWTRPLARHAYRPRCERARSQSGAITG